MIAHDTDHEIRGVSLLIDRYRKPDASALLASWLHEVQAAEDALWQLLTERTVANAAGVNLDALGRIVGQPREGRSDDVYRVWIAARVLVSRSSGLGPQLLEIAKKLAPLGATGGASGSGGGDGGGDDGDGSGGGGAARRAQAVGVGDGPYDVTGFADVYGDGGVVLVEGRKLLIAIDGLPPVRVLFTALPAYLATVATTSSYALSNGSTLLVQIDGGATQTITFHTADFPPPGIGAASASRVRTVIDAQLTGADAISMNSGIGAVIALRTHGTGASRQVQVMGGSANAVLGFSTAPVFGVGYSSVAAVTFAEMKAMIEASVSGVLVDLDALGNLVITRMGGAATSLQVTGDIGAALGMDTVVYPGVPVPAQVRLEEYFPAAVVIHMEGGIDAISGMQIAHLLSLAKAAGVGLQFEWFSASAGWPFSFARTDATEPESIFGFGAGALAAVSDGSHDVAFAPLP